MTKTETYQEQWEYSWVKSRSLCIDGMDAYNKLSDLLPAEWYAKNTLVYIIEEKKIYRAKHQKRLRYLGLT